MQWINKSLILSDRYGLRAWMAINNVALGLWLLFAWGMPVVAFTSIMMGLLSFVFFVVRFYTGRLMIGVLNMLLFWGVAFYFINTEPWRYVGYASLVDGLMASWLFFKLIFDRQVLDIY